MHFLLNWWGSEQNKVFEKHSKFKIILERLLRLCNHPLLGSFAGTFGKLKDKIESVCSSGRMLKMNILTYSVH